MKANDATPDLELNKASAAAGLTPPARSLHRLLLGSFVETGQPPARSALERMVHDEGVDLGPALSELAGQDVIALDAQGEIRAAYPFSPDPTRHRVTWKGGTGVYAMCAVDALGMSAMLGVPGSITSTEPGTGHLVTIEVDHDTARWQPKSAVVFAGTTGDACCPSVDRACDQINFFSTADTAHAWAAANPDVTGVVLDQDQALACGVAEFGTLLAER